MAEADKVLSPPTFQSAAFRRNKESSILFLALNDAVHRSGHLLELLMKKSIFEVKYTTQISLSYSTKASWKSSMY
jgi:hypothetical protein